MNTYGIELEFHTSEFVCHQLPSVHWMSLLVYFSQQYALCIMHITLGILGGAAKINYSSSHKVREMEKYLQNHDILNKPKY